MWCLIVLIPDPCPLFHFQDQLSLNAGQKYCRMLQGEHSAILSTFIMPPFVIKIFVLSIFEWPFYTGFTVALLRSKTFLSRAYLEVLICDNVSHTFAFHKTGFLFQPGY